MPHRPRAFGRFTIHAAVTVITTIDPHCPFEDEIVTRRDQERRLPSTGIKLCNVQSPFTKRDHEQDCAIDSALLDRIGGTT